MSLMEKVSAFNVFFPLMYFLCVHFQSVEAKLWKGIEDWIYGLPASSLVMSKTLTSFKKLGLTAKLSFFYTHS